MAREEDGTVISLETMRRREERKAAREKSHGEAVNAQEDVQMANTPIWHARTDGTSMEPVARAAAVDPSEPHMSKTQLKKLALFAPRPPPPKPTIPPEVTLPAGEENWLALWDLADEEIERRVSQAKKRKATERKQLRLRQQAGKKERRAARDEKRRVYRDLKMTWKVIKGELPGDAVSTITDSLQRRKRDTKRC